MEGRGEGEPISVRSRHHGGGRGSNKGRVPEQRPFTNGVEVIQNFNQSGIYTGCVSALPYPLASRDLVFQWSPSPDISENPLESLHIYLSVSYTLTIWDPVEGDSSLNG